MKRTLHSLAALVVVAAVLAAVPAKAQVIFFAGGGAAFPTGNLSDDGAETGWLGFVGLDYPLKAVPGAAIGLSGIYAHIPYEGDADDATNIPGGFVDIAYLFGMTSASMIKPYIRGGVGVIQHRYDPGGYGGDTESETKAAGAVGAGINFIMRSVSPFVGAHFVTGGSDTSFFSVYAGLSFGGGSPAAAPRRRF